MAESSVQIGHNRVRYSALDRWGIILFTHPPLMMPVAALSEIITNKKYEVGLIWSYS